MVIRNVAMALAAGLMLSVPWTARAKEGGDQSPNGMESWVSGALPPPGDYFLNYLGYQGGTLRDGRGHKVTFPGGGNASLDATFDALRWVHVSKTKILGADYGFHVIVPLVNLSIDHPAFGGRDSRFGIGDIVVDPLVLGWHRGDWHTILALDIFLPTGHYDRNDPRVSIGANYTSYEPVLAVSWLPPTGWEVSAKIMYNTKTKNDDTDYQSGDELHVDWLVGRTMGKWGLGVAGYYLRQVSDDKVAGQKVAAVDGVWSAGRRGQVFAYGPSIKYTTASHALLMAQWVHESHVENRFGGSKVVIKTVLPF